jgi:ABC-type lipoprotein release transport system permease subunit
MEGVRAVAPHARSTALLAFGTRVAGVELLGVDPPAEQAISRIARAISEGRYLEIGDRGVTVIGSTIAERLEVELDDDLFLTVVREGGEMEYAMLRIVGIVHTGSRDLDAAICHVTLEDVEQLTGLNGAGEITITLKAARQVEQIASTLRTMIPEGDDVLTWKEVQPAQGADFESDKAFTNLFVSSWWWSSCWGSRARSLRRSSSAGGSSPC